MGNTLKGRFKPQHPEKYKGDPSNIIYRSSWEKDVMGWCDKSDNIVSWSSEEKCFWYYDKVTKKNRRYFPDFIIDIKRDYGIETMVIEVKPQSQINGPNPQPKRRTKSWMYQVQTYLTNQCKWESMKSVCEDRGWSFKLLSEQDVRRWKK